MGLKFVDVDKEALMGKKGNNKESKKKMTKKEKKAANHLQLIQGKKGQSNPGEDWKKNNDDHKKSA